MYRCSGTFPDEFEEPQKAKSEDLLPQQWEVADYGSGSVFRV